MQSTIDILHIIIIVSLWTVYFLIHSLTASLGLKRWVAEHYPQLMPAYRLVFNFASTILILPILLLSYSFSSEPLWHWSPLVFWLMQLITLATVVAFYFSLRYYDMDEFIGIKQWSERNIKVEDQEAFKIGVFHRFVRHPWYSMGIVLIWSRELDPIMLTSAIMLTVYFVFGSILEERKLVLYHGDIYRQYMTKVPGLIPRPWRFLSRKQLKELLPRESDIHN